VETVLEDMLVLLEVVLLEAVVDVDLETIHPLVVEAVEVEQVVAPMLVVVLVVLVTAQQLLVRTITQLPQIEQQKMLSTV
jgi:hypothetical protein